MANDLLPFGFGKIFRVPLNGNSGPFILGFGRPTPEDSFTWFRSENFLYLSRNPACFPIQAPGTSSNVMRLLVFFWSKFAFTDSEMRKIEHLRRYQLELE